MLSWQAHREAVRSLAFSPDGRLLASVSDFSLRVRDLGTGRDVFRHAATHYPGTVSFSPDGRLLAWMGCYLRVWELGRPKPVIVVDGCVQQGCFAPDGAVFVGASMHQALRRWETASWQELPCGWGGLRVQYGSSHRPSGCIAYHPDGTQVAAGFEQQLRARESDSIAYLFDANTGAVRSTLRCRMHIRHPTRLAFTPTGELLAVLYGPRLRVWEVTSGQEVLLLETGRKHFNDAAFTPDGRRLVTVNNDAVVRLWDVENWEEVTAYEWQIGKLATVAVAPDGLRMATAGSSGSIVVWDVDG